MLILALETSTELGSCALWRDGAVTERRCPEKRPHSETLLPLVRDLLAESGLRIDALDAIAFGVGPGAFTGLRVACGAAQGLAVVAGLPLIPVTSLETLATAAGADRVLTLLDARMGEVYSACYERVGADYIQRGEIRVSAPGDIALPAGAGWLACGNGLTAYPGLLDRVRAAGLAVEPGGLPSAATVAAIAAAKAALGAGIDAAEAAPLYVRDKVAKTVAERMREGGKA